MPPNLTPLKPGLKPLHPVLHPARNPMLLRLRLRPGIPPIPLIAPSKPHHLAEITPPLGQKHPLQTLPMPPTRLGAGILTPDGVLLKGSQLIEILGGILSRLREGGEDETMVLGQIVPCGAVDGDMAVEEMGEDVAVEVGFVPAVVRDPGRFELEQGVDFDRLDVVPG